ncbi:metalloregulator ArsR/SmtB family transcription factor [Mesorhizobium australicum]
MGFSKRLLILLHLMDGERSVSEMVSLIGASRTALSQHLSGMAKLGIVKSRTQGKRRFYSCTSEQAKMVVSFLSDLADRDILPVGNARIATSFAKRLNSNDGGPNRPVYVLGSRVAGKKTQRRLCFSISGGILFHGRAQSTPYKLPIEVGVDALRDLQSPDLTQV